MSNNQTMHTELLKLNVSLIEKTNFMLLTASTASIAFVITQLKGLNWNNLIYLPMTTLILLSLSFFFGCKALEIMARALKSNSIYLKLDDSHDLKAALKFVETLISKANIYDSCQKFTFFSAAIIYAIYVFLVIYLNTYPNAIS
ncbi:hypothetical protein A7A69_07180 [Acinetobacter sp. Ac_1271]|nr:hypothetical protein [Acinetobacter guerrae]